MRLALLALPLLVAVPTGAVVAAERGAAPAAPPARACAAAQTPSYDGGGTQSLGVRIPAVTVVELDRTGRPVRVRTNTGRPPAGGDLVTSTSGRVSARVAGEVLGARWVGVDWSCSEAWHQRS